MRLTVSAIALAILACSPSVATQDDALVVVDAEDLGPDLNDGARSGTRLKLTWFELSDGARQWDGFYDAQRKENCYIYSWADGKSYCLPDYDGSLLYSNATCTNKVMEVYRDLTCPGAPAPYALEWSYTTCESKPAHLWVRGSPISLAQYYYKSSTGACNGPFATFADYDYYSVGGEIATTELVEVSLGAPTGAGRLTTRYYQSPDGMRLQGAVHDTVLGATCYPRTYATDATSGLCPPSARTASYDEDAACTKPKLSVTKSCAPPKFAADYPRDGCPSDPPSYYALGAKVAGAPLYYYSASACTAQTPSTTSDYYRIGEPATLAPVDRTIDTAGQRIKLVHYKNADGLKFRNYALYDSQKGAECYPTKLPDGTIRCLVTGGYSQSYFQNAACTIPIDVLLQAPPSMSCSAPPVPKYARKFVTPPDGSCVYGTQIHPVMAEHTAPVYQNTGTCTVYTPPAGYKFYGVGPQIPLAEFVSATITIDP